MNAESGSGGAAVIDPVAIAEDYVIAALRRLHCTIVRRVCDGEGPSPIEAWKTTEHLLLSVRSAVAPETPLELSPKEERELRQLAARANAEPWAAKVVLGPEMELVELDWWPLEERDPAE